MCRYFVCKWTREAHGAIHFHEVNRSVDSMELTLRGRFTERSISALRRPYGGTMSGLTELIRTKKFKDMTKIQLGYSAAIVGATLAFGAFAFAAPAFAATHCDDWCGGGDENNSVYISVTNDGKIDNKTEAKADTGGNWAGGSYGGDGGSAGDGGKGGDAAVAGGGGWCWECCNTCGGSDSEANGGDGGNGGDANGGDAGPGGLVTTGDADASAGTVNTLNTVDIEVEGCGCEEEPECCIPPWLRRDVDNHVKVKVKNDGKIENKTKAKAETGDNDADGSFGGDGGCECDGAGDGGDGGDAHVGDDGDGCGCEWDFGGGAGTANGGDGGNGGDANGGDGGVGGTVVTGDARSEAGTVNLMNTILIRVLR